MSNLLQREFFKFHEKIKLHDKEDNQDLRDKRDMLCKEIREHLKKKAKETGVSIITFSIENQGSYSMGTGIKPIKFGDFDIDVMVLFNISKDDYEPVEVKRWVFEALDRPNREVEYKKPCVRVQYFKEGEELFHVDLALYANQNSDGKTYLSKGKPNSATKDKKWEVSDPKLLKQKINSRFSDSEDRLQMKRIIRYLKRWKDFKFYNTENGKPTGIALTALAYNLFQPEIERNRFDSTSTVKDLIALRKLVSSILGEFNWLTGRISVNLPVEPHNDLFEKMTNVQQKNFKEKLEKLKTALESAEAEPDPNAASKILIKEFGDDFPEADKIQSAQRRDLAFPGKSESA